jgi:hypothetical protein
MWYFNKFNMDLINRDSQACNFNIMLIVWLYIVNISGYAFSLKH